MDIERALVAKVIEVTEKDLPLQCPLEGAPLWQLHPRVFLPIEESGEAVCPYCSTRYVLKDLQTTMEKKG